MAAAGGSFEWWDAVPWGLVIIGWLLVNKQNNFRETRKELRARIDNFKAQIDELEDLSVEHHTSVQNSLHCAKIKRLLVKLQKELDVIRESLSLDNYSVKLIRLRQAVTLRNFESSTYQPVSASDPIISEIGRASDDLRYLVESAYASEFKLRKKRSS